MNSHSVEIPGTRGIFQATVTELVFSTCLPRATSATCERFLELKVLTFNKQDLASRAIVSVPNVKHT
jgi:hypothetical protein